jgi:hypothetical protein
MAGLSFLERRPTTQPCPPSTIRSTIGESTPIRQRRAHPRFIRFDGLYVAPPRTLDCDSHPAAGAKLRVFETLELLVRFTWSWTSSATSGRAGLARRSQRWHQFIGDPGRIGQTFASVLPVARLFSDDR